MAITPHLGLTLVEQSQAQKEITVNEALSRVDALLNTGAISRAVATPPGAPLAGDVYIVGASATGAWAGKSGQITYFEQVWRFVVPRAGMTLWVGDEAMLYSFNGTAWVASGGNAILGAPALSPVYDNDFIPVIRGGNLYLATVADCVAYVTAGGASGQLDFSNAGNSGLTGVL
ncbi:MAG: DUF2793 domain-containing protein [Rickettsiales bacterium]|nr:DUF2793 domain-containing protein [Rickettsiales bacterium]